MRTPKKRHILALLLSVCLILTMIIVTPVVKADEGGSGSGTAWLEFRNGSKVENDNAVNFSLDDKTYKVGVSVFESSGSAISSYEWNTEGTNPELKNISDSMHVTFTLSSDGEIGTPVPKLNVSGGSMNFELSSGSYTLTYNLSQGAAGSINVELESGSTGEGEGQGGPQGGGQGPEGSGGEQGPQGNNNRTPYTEGTITASITCYNEEDASGAQSVEDLQYFDDSSLNEDDNVSTDLLIHFMAPAGNILRKVLINDTEVNSGIKPDKVTFEYFMTKPESGELSIQVYYDINQAFSQRPNIVWVYSEQTGQEKKFVDPQGRVDCLVEHGIVKIEEVILPDGTVTETDKKSVLTYNDLTATVEEDRGQGMGRFPKYNEANYEDGGDNRETGFGYAEITAGSTVTIKVIPDYGYQVSGAELNGCKLTPLSDVSTFSFVMADRPLHLSAVFTPGTDTISDNSDSITGASISNGQNAANSGNLKLTVEDKELSADAQTAVLAAANGDNISYVSTIDMTLDNIVSKGNGDFWESNITSFESNITVGLNLENPGAGYTYDIIRNHDGQLEDLNATYANGVLSVPTNRFSEYSIIKKKSAVKPSYNAPTSSISSNTAPGNTTSTEKSGNITNSTNSTSNAASAKLEAKTEEITESILTEEEKTLVKDGKSLEVSLKVNEISEGRISATEKSIIETVTESNDLTMGTVFDINLFVTNGNDERKVTNTNGGISISLELPKALINADSSVRRVYGVLRIHNGVSALLNAKYDASTNTLSFETDRFSTYVLVYKDLGEDEVIENITDTVTETEFDGTVVDEPETNTEKTEQSAPSSSIKSPKTADDLLNYLMIISIMLSLISLGVTLLAIRRN